LPLRRHERDRRHVHPHRRVHRRTDSARSAPEDRGIALVLYDVVIAGGGPSGSVCAATLARKGLRVLVLEKTKFPRFHLGESLLPNSLPVLDAIGVLSEAKERFIFKYGARFHQDHGPKRRK